MDYRIILDNLLSPPILFFCLGMGAYLSRSDLDIPQPLPKLFSLYLLFSIGLRGGLELRHSTLNVSIFLTLFTAVLMALTVPCIAFWLLRRKFGVYNAAAIAATYGSVSAVTFITASNFLARLNIPSGGYMVAAMALMESPAIIIGVLFARVFSKKEGEEIEWKELLREAFLNGSVVLLLGSLLIGLVTSEKGAQALKPFYGDIFPGMLAFFLLDMGLVAARRIRDILKSGGVAIGFAIGMPLFNASIGILLAKLIGMPQGDALLFTVLCASASYIAVPAALRLSVPEANPSLYISMSLALTFPFNIVVGIPTYMFFIHLVWR